jgi:hypothetical protein
MFEIIFDVSLIGDVAACYSVHSYKFAFILFHIIFLSSLTLALHFSLESHWTHTTQDTDHGAPHSQRVTMTNQDRDMGRGRRMRRGRQHYLSDVDSSSSHNASSSEPYTHEFDTYMAPDTSQLVQDMQLVYE